MAYNRSVFPEQLDTPIEMYDISALEKPEIDEYFILCTLTNPTPDQITRIAELLEKYNNKIINAEKINYFMDIAINTEKFWFDNVNNYLKFITSYNNLYPYKIYNTTMDINGDLYMSLNSNNIGNPLSNATMWRKISQRGLQGVQGERGFAGIGLAFIGSYDSTATYTINQGVEQNGSLYGCTSPIPITGISPSSSTNNWSMVVSKGSSTFLTVLRNSVTVSTNTAIVPINIVGFNKNSDQIFVYIDKDYVEQEKEYMLNSDGLSIVKEVGTWDGTIAPVNFNFVVFKNIVEGVALADGSLIQIQSITLDKLNLDVQNKISKIGDSFLQTIAQSLSGAVNENTNNLESHIVDYVKHPAYITTTGIANNYIVTLDAAPTNYVDGMGIIAKINIDSTGASTMNVNVLGNIPMKDGYGNSITNFKANTIYSFRFEAISQTFMLQGASTPVNTFSQISDPAIYAKSNDIWFDLTNKLIKFRVGNAWVPFDYTYA